MVLPKLVAEEGMLLDHALRRIKLKRAASAWGIRWVEGEVRGGGSGEVAAFRLAAVDGEWQMVEMKEAAVVVNPVARKLWAALEEAGVRGE